MFTPSFLAMLGQTTMGHNPPTVCFRWRSPTIDERQQDKSQSNIFLAIILLFLLIKAKLFTLSIMLKSGKADLIIGLSFYPVESNFWWNQKKYNDKEIKKCIL